MNIKHQNDYPGYLPSPNDLHDGDLREGDLITNMLSQAVWEASKFDVDTIKPDIFDNDKKFRKMLPVN